MKREVKRVQTDAISSSLESASVLDGFGIRSARIFLQFLVCDSCTRGNAKDIIARLNAEVVKAARGPEIRRKLEELGFAVRGSPADELRVMTRDQLIKYGR